ncbi:hypothetical protein GQ53DRAFT_741297 [Thozetella sp. PMI_491]|nr:hypothetical protein GQ53DRAFT_741297 [Thozetella sp. PMI_491]
MPAPLRCQPLCGLPSALSARAMASIPSKTRAVAAATVVSSTRYFSSTRVQSRIVVPPESPLYITIPEPPQSSEERSAPVRGHLPRPRQIFRQRGGMSKLDPDFVERTAPLSKKQLTGDKPKSEVQLRKWEMAEVRRKSLAEGIEGLWERKHTFDLERRRRSQIKFQFNRRAARRPDALDEMLSHSTVLGATSTVTKVALDPNRFQVAEEARQAHAEKMAQKSEARQDALARLYMASADFIVDEAELETKVNDIFDNPKYLNTALDKTESQWGFGPPINITQLRKMMEDTGLDSKKSTLATNRQKQLAEELMGGKME